MSTSYLPPSSNPHPFDGQHARRPTSMLETAQFPADTLYVAEARRFVRHVIEATGDESLAADFELISSELITNAIEHGTGDLVDLAVEGDQRSVTLTVISRGNAGQVAPSNRWAVADPDSVTGRGLGIVRALADRIDVHRRGDELRIAVERHRHVA